MPSDFATLLRAFAGVLVRVGLNLQRGQRLLITEPYELQGVARSAEIIVAAVRAAAREAGCPHPAGVEVIWGDGPRLREIALNKDWRSFVQLVDGHARKMQAYLQNHDALLFLQGSQPGLMVGVPAGHVAELRRLGWEYFGPIARQLVAGATNWTVAPAPSPAWAHAVFADLPSEKRLAALWEAVFGAMRIPRWNATSGRARENPPGGRVSPQDSALAAWHTHLLALQNHRDHLNTRRMKTLRYVGAGTDLTVALPPEHRWCTAQLATESGLAFVANLPTEEVFTLPHRDSAEGIARVSRPVSYGGAVIDGIELEFRRGRVVRAQARQGETLLTRLLETDDGACRLGEVALVGGDPERDGSRRKVAPKDWNGGRLFQHPLLDENATNHIALGEAYPFCLQAPNPAACNRSLIHVDLPLDAGLMVEPT